jgi:DNA-binding SARP family transcriptional activator
MLELWALGTLELKGTTDSLEPILARPKRAAVLAYLVLDRPGLFHRHRSLAAMFWPGMDTPAAHDALDRELAALRRELPDGVITDRDGGRVGVAMRSVRCDVHDFEDHVAAGRWAEALALYRGDLLDGLTLPETDGFRDWLAEERKRLRLLAALASDGLARESA